MHTFINQFLSKLGPQNFFQKIEKSNDDVFFPVSVLEKFCSLEWVSLNYSSAIYKVCHKSSKTVLTVEVIVNLFDKVKWFNNFLGVFKRYFRSL